MRLILASLGRWHKGPELALYEHYAGRFEPLGKRLGLGALELAEIRDEDAERLLSVGPPGTFRIALDSSGTALSSEALAQLISRLRTEARPAASFLIGGADGLATILDRADKILSLGPQTWPHLLVRGMLSEQLYRAATILLNHPYHQGH